MGRCQVQNYFLLRPIRNRAKSRVTENNPLQITENNNNSLKEKYMHFKKVL